MGRLQTTVPKVVQYCLKIFNSGGQFRAIRKTFSKASQVLTENNSEYNLILQSLNKKYWAL